MNMGVSNSDENKNIDLMKPIDNQGKMVMGERKLFEKKNNGQTRKPLGVISQNTVGVQRNSSGFNKRSLEHVNRASEKIPPIYPHRPITKNLAAKTASSSNKLSSQEKKKPKTPLDSFGVWNDDTSVIDVDEEHETVPMSLEKRKEISHENDDHMEVEMEDIFEEAILEIDTCDLKNPFAATEYLEDLYTYYRNVECSSCISPNYMANQFDINSKMRGILIDWLIEVNYKFELRAETLFLTVNLIDRFLEKHRGVERKKLQLIGLVAMLLACKYEEVSVPLLDDFVFISDQAYTRREILEMENLMVNTLQFNMSVPTAFVFMTRYLKAAQSDKKLEFVSFFLIELCLVEYEMLQFPPSLMAAAAIYTAQCTLYGANRWSKTIEWYTKYSEDQLLECARIIASFHQKSGTGKLTGVYRKYSTSKFIFAAKCEPAKFLVYGA